MPDNYLGALQRVLDIRPEWLLGSHIIPLQGKDRISEAVTKYRDATQYLWDQSVRLINKGYTPVELQHAITDLPEGTWDPPFTVPSYGTPFTTVPEFFTGWVSWFTGDATDLFPSPYATRANRLTELMGGVEAVLDAAKADHRSGDHQLAAELAQIALRADPDNDDARLLKAAALRARGYQEVNPIARSWYLTGALELEGAIDPTAILVQMGAMFAGAASAVDTVRAWRYHLDAGSAAGQRLTVGLRLTDTGEELTVRVRHSILLVDDGVADDADAVVELTADDLDDPAVVTTVSGDGTAWSRLHSWLDLEPTGFHMHMR
jgi:alkyl sulfatase BDS1-like metallo-beta-lactamase superfamily hydrolase